MSWTQHDMYRSRAVTCALLDAVDEGIIDRDTLIQDLLGWMSEADVAEFARRNDYLVLDEEEEEEEELPSYDPEVDG